MIFARNMEEKGIFKYNNKIFLEQDIYIYISSWVYSRVYCTESKYLRNF